MTTPWRPIGGGVSTEIAWTAVSPRGTARPSVSTRQTKARGSRFFLHPQRLHDSDNPLPPPEWRLLLPPRAPLVPRVKVRHHGPLLLPENENMVPYLKRRLQIVMFSYISFQILIENGKEGLYFTEIEL